MMGLNSLKTDNRRILFTLVLTLGLGVIATFLSGGTFLTASNVKNLVMQNAVLGVVAMGQLVVIISGGINLSIGSVVGLSTVLIVGLQDYGLGAALFITVVSCGLIGLVTGVLVTVWRLPAFVITLGMMLFVFSLAQVISGGSALYNGFNGGEISAYLMEFSSRTFLGIPYPALTWILTIAVVSVFLRSSYGRYLYAYGDNRDAAHASGIPVLLIGILAFVLGSILAGAGGFLSVARVAKGTPSAGATYLVDSIAAVAIGGASLSGGTGTVLGTFLAVLILGVLNNIMNLVGVSPMLQPAVKGAIILLAVYLNSRESGS